MPIIPAEPSALFDKFHCFLTNGSVSRTPSVADLAHFRFRATHSNGFACGRGATHTLSTPGK
ncbi:hypothetical protein PtB15_4B804 [Puccinia triticina]|nr:hypothetical protein PtB15_4B804 [Puccinia triticina]